MSESKKAHAMESSKARKAKLQEKIECQEAEYKAKKELIASSLGLRETPILTKLSKSPSAKSARKCRGRIEDMMIAKEMGVSVDDFTGAVDYE